MKEVVIGGLFALVTALVSGWLVDGGIKRRARRTIREELELADLPGCPAVEAAALRASAERRLHRYVTPLRTRLRDLSRRERAGAWIGAGLGTLGAVSGAVTAAFVFPEAGATDAGQVLVVAGLLGATAGLAFALLEFGLERIARSLGWVFDIFVAGVDSVFGVVQGFMKWLERRLREGRRRRQ